MSGDEPVWPECNSVERESAQASSHSLTLSQEMGHVEEYDEGPNPTSTISETPTFPPTTTKTLPARSLIVYRTFSIHIICLLMPFSVFGTLARLGIHALVTYPQRSIFPLAWVQAVGCLVMGFALALREPITKFYGPLYPAITTGFCGALTTFSSWQLDVFAAWGHGSGVSKLWIYNVMDGLTRLLFTLAVAMSSLGLGVHLGKRLVPRLPKLSSPPPMVRWLFTGISVAIYALTIPFFIRLNPAWRPLATAALMFSFPGTLTRYVMSTQLNPRVKLLPMGTLLSNELATAILVACHIIQRAPSTPGSISCSILQGFIDGYCGCFSTVSTFASEIRMLDSRKSWIYVTISLGLGQAICLVLLGPVWWTGRLREDNLCVSS